VRLLFVIVGLSTPVFGVELGLRSLGPFLPGNYYSGDLYLEPHPVFGRFHVPNTTGWLRTEEYTTRVDLNSKGLRDRELPYSKPGNVQRVMVVGDSFVEGEEVSAEAMLTRRMEAHLNPPGMPQTEVINGGVRAFSTAQEYLFLKEEALRYQPDAVVLVFYSGNDVADTNPRIVHNVASRHRPYFDIDNHGNLKALPFRPERTPELDIVDRLRRDSLLFNVVDTGVLAKLDSGFDSQDEAMSSENESEPTQPDRRLVKNELPVFSDTSTGSWDHAWDVVESLIVASRDAANGVGAEFLLVYAPTKWEVYPEDWEEIRTRNSLPSGGWDLDGPSERMGAIAARHRFSYVDLGPTFRSEASSPDRLFYRSDIHWTPRGHDVAAQQVANALASGSRIAQLGR
jgi:hypothetical protein